jgi:UDP-galactopyranose mutase
MKKKYDFVIVGAGPFGCTAARVLTDNGHKCLVIEARDMVGGLTSTMRRNDIDVHLYGPHILHTSNPEVWNFLNKYSEFYNYRHNSCILLDKKMYQLPFNMNTCNTIFGTHIPLEAYKKIMYEIREYTKYNSKFVDSLESVACKKFGTTLYNKFIKPYSEKLWGRNCYEINPVPLDNFNLYFDYNQDYFRTIYQGVPVDGWTKLFENMLGDDIDILLNTNFLTNPSKYMNLGNTIIYTGSIDEFCNYIYGMLPYRTCHFDINNESQTANNMFGTAVINIADPDIDMLRIIEHKWLNPPRATDEFNMSTWVSYAYVSECDETKYKMYPINNEESEEKYQQYVEFCKKNFPNVIFCGRQGSYRLLNIAQCVKIALDTFK